MNRYVVAILLVLVLGIAGRGYGVVQYPFEQDELYTVNEATLLFDTPLQPGIQARPVFFLLEHPLITNAPVSPVVLRIIPFIFGLLGFWVTWKLARRVMDRGGATVALLLLALSPWHMHASAFGRYYALIYFLAALVYWRLPIAYDTNRPRDYLYALIPLLVGAWTHPSFTFPVAGAALAMMAVSREGAFRWQWPSRNAWAFLWVPFGAVCALVFTLIKIFHSSSAVDNGGDRGLLATLRLLPAMVDWMTVVVFVAAIAGAIALVTSRVPERRRLGWMTLVGGATMFVVLFALSFKTGIYADYGMAALPLVMVAAASAVQWVRESVAPERQTMAGGLVTALIVAAMLPSVVSHLSDGTRFDYRPALDRIRKEGPNQAVLAWPIIIQRQYAPELRSYELLPSRKLLDSLLTKERDLWAVVSVKRYGIVGDDSGEAGAWLNTHCLFIDSHQRPRLDYRMYRVDLWRCQAASSDPVASHQHVDLAVPQ